MYDTGSMLISEMPTQISRKRFTIKYNAVVKGYMETELLTQYKDVCKYVRS